MELKDSVSFSTYLSPERLKAMQRKIRRKKRKNVAQQQQQQQQQQQWQEPTNQLKIVCSVGWRTREGKDKRDGCHLPRIFPRISSNRRTASPATSSTSALLLLLPNPALVSVLATVLPLIHPSNEVFRTLGVHNRQRGSNQPLS